MIDERLGGHRASKLGRFKRCDCAQFALAAAHGWLAATIAGAPVVLACVFAPLVAQGQEIDPAVLKAESDRVAVVERASSAAVAVMAAGGQGGGSAVLISPDGYAVSNFHVTREAGEAMKCGLSDGRLYDAVIVGVDPTGDAALLQLLGRDDFPFAEMADSDRVRAGDWCFAIGNPFLLATDFKPTVTFGVISGVHRYQFPAGTLLEYTDCLQADAAINPGNSGGPLFDGEGRLIGINGRGSFEKRGRVNVGVGYAISVNQIKNFLGQLKTGRVVDHATLGASLATNSDGRVLVDDILEDSDAFRRGLRYGDEVLAFGGRPITSTNAFKNVLGIYPKGWRVPLTYRRISDKVAGEPVQILVRLAGVHREAELQSLISEQPKAEPQPGRKPKPGKKPAQPKKPGEPQDPKQPQDPEQPKPQHARGHRPKAPMPDVVKKRFTAKPGYVNYFFNQLNQDRVWKAATARGDFGSATGKWVLAGELAEGGDWQITLDDQRATIRMPGGELTMNADEANLSKSLAPPESGGLLAALWLWRRMLILGPQHFGQTRYAGTEPLLGHEPLHDVIVGTHKAVDCRFVFNPENGQIAALEMFPDEQSDPCEVYFQDYQEHQGRLLPSRMEVRYGDGVYHIFDVRRAELDVAAKPGAANPAPVEPAAKKNPTDAAPVVPVPSP